MFSLLKYVGKPKIVATEVRMRIKFAQKTISSLNFLFFSALFKAFRVLLSISGGDIEDIMLSASVVVVPWSVEVEFEFIILDIFENIYDIFFNLEC